MSDHHTDTLPPAAPDEPEATPELAETAETITLPPDETAPPPPTAPPRLTRSRDDRVVAGVAAGIARYLGVDPVIIRIAFVILTLAGGSGVLAYLVAMLVIPEDTGRAPAASARSTAGPQGPLLRAAAGAFLVLLGLSWLLEQVLPGISRVTWPVTLMLIGAVLIFTGGRR